MEERILTEILAAHADCLNEGKGRKEDYLSMFPAYQAQLAPLLALAETVKSALRPLRPDEAFRQRLRAELLEAADRSLESLASSEEGSASWFRDRKLLIGAVVGSALSVFGLAYFLRERIWPAKRAAPSG